MPQINVSEVTIETKTHIDKYNPMDYLEILDEIPECWIDHYDSSSRKIRCVSDGAIERLYFKGNHDNVEPDDTDDFLYYLDAALGADWLKNKEEFDDETGKLSVKNPANVNGETVLLEEGKDYTLKKAGMDYDTDLGLVWIEEIDNDYGYPAFLFEELSPISANRRKESYKTWLEQLDSEEID